jgi:hypothetical protein
VKPPASSDTLYGVCIEAGEVEPGENPRLVIEVTRPELARFHGNIVFAEVTVRLMREYPSVEVSK